jgi:signal transduction histidine kinase
MKKQERGKAVQVEEQVRSRDRRKADFVATVSHDLKSPLNAVIGFTSVLLQDARGNAEQERQLQMVQASARQLLDRINDLLEFHRLEAGKVKVNPVWCSLRELCLQALEPWRAPAAAQGLILELSCTGTNGRVRSDPCLLLRVLKEFLSNAVRFSKKGVVVLGCCSEPGDQPERIRLRLEVRDPGLGLSADSLAKLSAAFAPGGSILERCYDGLGLGLALCRESAALLGGIIHVTGAPGAGCTFSLLMEFPISEIGP